MINYSNYPHVSSTMEYGSELVLKCPGHRQSGPLGRDQRRCRKRSSGEGVLPPVVTIGFSHFPPPRVDIGEVGPSMITRNCPLSNDYLSVPMARPQQTTRHMCEVVTYV